MLGPDEVAAWFAEHASPQERAGVAVTGTWGRGTGNLTGIAVAFGDHGAFLDPVALTESDEQALAAWLADQAQGKAMHDAKGPMHAFAARGLALDGLTSDTALAAYLALPGQRTFDLADLSLRYLGKELRETAEQRPAHPGRLGRGGGRHRARAAGSRHGGPGRRLGRRPGRTWRGQPAERP